MVRASLDEQFAMMPEQLKGALIGLMDAVSDAGRQGALKDSEALLKNLSGLEAVPAASQAILSKTRGVATVVLLQEHMARVAWARAEGFTGFDAFLVAIGASPESESNRDEGASASDEPTQDDEDAPDNTHHVFAHALDAIATGTHSLETTQSLVAASMDEIDPVALATALAHLAHDLLTRWAAAAGADRDDAWLAWSQMVREEA